MASVRITAAVAHDETAPIRLISEHIPEDSGIEVTEEFTTFELNADACSGSTRTCCWSRAGRDPTRRWSLLQLWHTVRSRTPIVLLSHGSDQDFVAEAFAAGADDFLVLHPGPYIPEQIAVMLSSRSARPSRATAPAATAGLSPAR